MAIGQCSKKLSSNSGRYILLLGTLFALSCSGYKTGSSTFTISLQRLPYLVNGEEVKQLYDAQPNSFLGGEPTLRFTDNCENKTSDTCNIWGKQAYDAIPKAADKYIALEIYSERNVVDIHKGYGYFSVFGCGNRNDTTEPRYSSLVFTGENLHSPTFYIPLPQYRGVLVWWRSGQITNPASALCMKISFTTESDGNFYSHSVKTKHQSNTIVIPAQHVQQLVDKYDCGLSVGIRKSLPGEQRNYAAICSQYLK